jgi:tetratricopeptide (TPR) repeat protein
MQFFQFALRDSWVQSFNMNTIMRHKLLLMTVCGSLLAGAASGQNAPAAGTNANVANTYVRNGTKLINQHKPGEALKAFEQASTLQPDNEQAAVGQYISLVQLKRVNDGAKVLDNWVAAKADDPQRWLCKGMAEAETDRPEAALKSFEKLTELQPNEGGNWVGKGEMLVALKRDDEALKAFDRAISLNPKHEGAWNDRGGVLLRLGKYDEAIQSYDKSINLAPRWEDSFYHRACAYAGKGDKTNALADLKKAIELQPSLKAKAVKEAYFKSLLDDPDFKKLNE